MIPGSIMNHFNLIRNDSCLWKAGKLSQTHEKSALDSVEGKLHGLDYAREPAQ